MPIPTNDSGTSRMICSNGYPAGYPPASGTMQMIPPRYCGNVAYYAAVAACGGNAAMNGAHLFDKREKAAHRCDIADTHGPVQLTVPVSKPHGIPRATWADVRVSDHGRWWHVHRVTLESAYGRTPFFEFYIDRFTPFLCRETVERYPRLIDLDQAIDAEIRKILLLPPAPQKAGEAENSAANSALHITRFKPEEIKPYYQVRSAELGFIPNLSILDLIFNLGPEAPLYLANLATKTVGCTNGYPCVGCARGV